MRRKPLPRKLATRLWCAGAAALLCMAQTELVYAHPLAPSLLEIIESETGRAEVTWKTPAVRAPGRQMRPRLPSFCRNRFP